MRYAKLHDVIGLWWVNLSCILTHLAGMGREVFKHGVLGYHRLRLCISCSVYILTSYLTLHGPALSSNPILQIVLFITNPDSSFCITFKYVACIICNSCARMCLDQGAKARNAAKHLQFPGSFYSHVKAKTECSYYYNEVLSNRGLPKQLRFCKTLNGQDPKTILRPSKYNVWYQR